MIRIIHITIIAAILCLSNLLFAADEPFVIIDSLKGRAEVQRAGQQKWQLIGKNGRLFNNDILRVLDSSLAQLNWQNGSMIYVNANSQILVNLYKDTVNDKLTNYATVFFGAVYFIIKKTLPKEVFVQNDTKVYTPTAILAIRGTSFTVDVNQQNGATKVGIINGTVLVRNILKSQSLFLSAGYKTEISINTDPLVPAPLLEKEIAALKIWVPPSIVAEQMSEQITEAKQAYTTITGKLEDKIIIMPFTNTSYYKGNWNITEKLAILLAEQMRMVNRVKCSTTSAQEAGSDPLKLGQDQKARFVITGEITKFDIIKRAEITAAADKYKEIAIAQVGIQIQLIDIGQQSVIYKNDIIQEISGANIEGNSWKYIAALKFDIKDQAFASSILGKAVTQTIDQTTAHLSRYMGLK